MLGSRRGGVVVGGAATCGRSKMDWRPVSVGFGGILSRCRGSVPSARTRRQPRLTRRWRRARRTARWLRPGVSSCRRSSAMRTTISLIRSRGGRAISAGSRWWLLTSRGGTPAAGSWRSAGRRSVGTRRSERGRRRMRGFLRRTRGGRAYRSCGGSGRRQGCAWYARSPGRTGGTGAVRGSTRSCGAIRSGGCSWREAKRAGGPFGPPGDPFLERLDRRGPRCRPAVACR